MFIRLKKIKGKDYAYKVQNTWTGKGSRQKVTGYMGKVHKPEKAREKKLKEFLNIESAEEYFKNAEYKNIIDSLIKLELHNHNVEEHFKISGNSLKTQAGKEAIVQTNQGFICSETIKSLLEYNPEQDNGYILASLITAAGLNIEKEIFVLLFEKTKSQKETKTDFYY